MAGGQEWPGSEPWDTYTQSQGITSNEKLSPDLMSQGHLQSPVFLLSHTCTHSPSSQPPNGGQRPRVTASSHTCQGTLSTLTFSPSCPGLESVLQWGGTDLRSGSLVSVAVPGSGGSVSIGDSSSQGQHEGGSNWCIGDLVCVRHVKALMGFSARE